MRILYQRCCGLDVHKESVMACVLTPEGKQIQKFGTMTKDLLMLSDWLAAFQVTHVAMESTGVFWQPIYNLLEEEFTVWVVNARHIKNVSGRKTNVKDAEWIADLLSHGLLSPSFIPGRSQRELWELVRYRRRLIQNRSQIVNRIQKVLEAANIKLDCVASDIMGASGLAMLRAMAAGETNPDVLADLAKGKLRDKIPFLKEALRGQIGPHQRFMLSSHLRVLDAITLELEELDREVATRMGPDEEAIERLDSIPGVGRRSAEEILAETGTDMSRFPSAAHLASWAKVSPGNNESAGKRQSGRTGNGNPWIKSALTEAAQAAAKTKDKYFAAQYRRLAPRRGRKRAIAAVAHSILVTIYYMLRDNVTYQELGGDYFDARDRLAIVRRAARRIEGLGDKVALEPV
ncbi:MAG TPA: IS110 family transposase [Dehalococcoidia bacterium]|nr:IS110 family transposase [Dehalococcoidia bacterium]